MGRQKAALLVDRLHEGKAHRRASHRLTVADILSWEAVEAPTGVPGAVLVRRSKCSTLYLAFHVYRSELGHSCDYRPLTDLRMTLGRFRVEGFVFCGGVSWRRENAHPPPPSGLPRTRGRSMVEGVERESRLGRRQAAGSCARTASAKASLGGGEPERQDHCLGILCG